MKRNRSYDGGCRRSFSEWMDSVLSSGIGRQLLVYLGTIIIVYAFFVLLSFSLNGFELTKDNSSETGSRLLGVLYYFLDPGNLYVEQNSSARFLTPVISLLGMFLLGGLLITTLSNGVEQRISNIKNGLVHYRNIHGHYVVIGFGEISLSLLRDIFEKNGYVPGQKTGGLPKIVILTSQNVEQVRAIIEAGLPDGMSRKVIIYAGNIESREHLEKLNISRAREVFILGEQDEYGRDTKNLEAIRTIHELCADRDRIREILTRVGLWDWISSLPAGIDSMIAEAGNTVSGGQKQRIGIARALYKGASVLFFDEATSSVDAEAESEINAFIGEMSEMDGNLTVIVIAHRQETLDSCGRVIELEKLM